MKKILLLILACVALPLFASANTADICRNGNILAYSPQKQTTHTGNFIIFVTKSNIKISSLETSFNGISRPVQYKQFGDFIRAKVMIPTDLTGDIVTTIGAQSQNSCNTPITFLFTK